MGPEILAVGPAKFVSCFKKPNVSQVTSQGICSTSNDFISHQASCVSAMAAGGFLNHFKGEEGNAGTLDGSTQNCSVHVIPLNANRPKGEKTTEYW